MTMLRHTDVLTDARTSIAAATTPAEVEHLRTVFLGRKGKMAALMSELPKLDPVTRREHGQALNQTKQEIEGLLHERLAAIQPKAVRALRTDLPGEPRTIGHLHPLTQFSDRVIEIWRSFGFDVHEGPELEDAWFNFDGLNVAPDHPVRDVQDTFFIAQHPELVLRTHSSTVQLRWPKSHEVEPPFRVVEIGKVYRHEATDATHESMFFQCDGVYVDRHVSMAHLITTLRAFLDRLYPGRKIRIRASQFAFVEPGIEVDLWWEQPGKKGRWLEMLGAGLVHPKVIAAMDLDPKEWQGFAFGMGLDRLAMLEYQVPDIRLFYNGQLDFLRQF